MEKLKEDTNNPQSMHRHSSVQTYFPCPNIVGFSELDSGSGASRYLWDKTISFM